jgi:hypothetical protein
VRGFAVVHCIGILTSMFSAVSSRAAGQPLVRPAKKLKSVAIGRSGARKAKAPWPRRNERAAVDDQAARRAPCKDKPWNFSASAKTSRS